uniref:Arrestin-like N-terminal domain-containing protein n=1 Tax=Romanomermis culicivorax TaxID=13658 RepID=A0A915IZS6_ROMCU
MNYENDELNYQQGNPQDKKNKQIIVQLRGLARVEFKNFGNADPKIVKDSQFILDRQICVWPPTLAQRCNTNDRQKPNYLLDQQVGQILSRGSHNFPFSFQLSKCQLPCSFESKSGRIRYWIKVALFDCFSTPRSMKKGIKYFTIVGPNIDCKDEKYLAPMMGHARKSNYACRRTKLVLDVKLKRTAYFCNELINLIARVDNQTDQSVDLRIKLRQNVQYRSDMVAQSYGCNKLVIYTVCEHRGPIFGARCDGIYDSMLEHPIRIPVVPPTMVGVSIEDEETIEEVSSVNFPFTIGTFESRVKNNRIDYDFCSPHVEGGMFIDKKFRSSRKDHLTANSDDHLFQMSFATPTSSSVHSLTDDDDDDYDENDHQGFMVILYRPMYVALADCKVLRRKGSRQLQDAARMMKRRSTLKLRSSKSYCNLQCLSLPYDHPKMFPALPAGRKDDLNQK